MLFIYRLRFNKSAVEIGVVAPSEMEALKLISEYDYPNKKYCCGIDRLYGAPASVEPGVKYATLI